MGWTALEVQSGGMDYYERQRGGTVSVHPLKFLSGCVAKTATERLKKCWR